MLLYSKNVNQYLVPR